MAGPGRVCAAVATAPLAPAYAADRIVIQPKRGTSPQALAGFHESQGGKVLRTFERLGRMEVLSVPRGQTVRSFIARCQQSGLVEFAEPDYLLHTALVPNDPAFTNATSSWGLNKIEAPAAWNVLTSASNIVVAVLDTGVRYTHEDLAANMWVNPNDGSHGWNAVAGTNDPWDDAANGHGTLMSGVIGAVGDNGIGLAGVAWGIQIMACKCFNSSGNGTNSDIIACMEYARSHGARIMNASWNVLGGTNFSLALSNAIFAARDDGIIFVTSAGNGFFPVNIDLTASYPANYQIDNIVTVAYTGRTDALGSYSNYGQTNVHLFAPGELIYSTLNSSNSGYSSGGIGTSFAAAYVSGALALMLAEFPNENYGQIINRLLGATDRVSSLATKCRTGGRLNLRKALTPILVTGTPSPGGVPFQLSVSATTNLTCILQASTDLTNWSPIFTNTTSALANSATGTFDFTDMESTNGLQKFYRAVAPP